MAGRRLADATRLYEFSLRMMNDDHDEVANFWRDSRAASFRQEYIDPQLALAGDGTADLGLQHTAYTTTLETACSAENEHIAGLTELSESEIAVERALQIVSEVSDIVNSVFAECHRTEDALQEIEQEVHATEYDPG